MKTIIWHLNARGIFLDGDKPIDIYSLHQNLEEIIGNISEIVMDEICDSLIKLYRTSQSSGSKKSLSSQSSYEIRKDASALEKITQLLGSTEGGPSREK